MTTPDSRAREAAQYLAALTAERDEYKQRMQRLRKERDALKEAARLALDARVESEPHPDDANYEDAVEAITALKAVL